MPATKASRASRGGGLGLGGVDDGLEPPQLALSRRVDDLVLGVVLVVHRGHVTPSSLAIIRSEVPPTPFCAKSLSAALITRHCASVGSGPRLTRLRRAQATARPTR